jgi:hypothetical protein
MKRLRDPSEKEVVDKKKYAGLLNLLFEFAGPDDHFVRAFFAQALAHLALAPDPGEYARPTLVGIAGTSRFFYRAYHEAHTQIVFPELDRRFAAFAKAYEEWVPRKGEKDRYNREVYPFEPLRFRGTKENTQPVVAKLSMLHWLALHRYRAPMSAKSRANIDTALSAYTWISWFQNGTKTDPEWNILARPWHEHDLPTLACAAIAHSHRCVEGAFEALMWAYIDDTSRERQREFITIWTFFGMMASLWNEHCTMHEFWYGWTSDIVMEDKIKKSLMLKRCSYGVYEAFVGFLFAK